MHEAIDYLKDMGRVHKQQDLVEVLGMGKANLSRALNGADGYFTEGFIKRLAGAYSDYINEKWILTGEGKMAKPLRETRPHVHAKAAAGFMNAVSEGEYGDDEQPLIPFVPDYDFTIEVVGESMLPDYREGDILICKIANDRLNPPIGKVCVIDGHEGAAVKEITGVTDSAIVCHSVNPAYPDYETEFGNIHQIAEVVGLLRV